MEHALAKYAAHTFDSISASPICLCVDSFHFAGSLRTTWRLSPDLRRAIIFNPNSVQGDLGHTSAWRMEDLFFIFFNVIYLLFVMTTWRRSTQSAENRSMQLRGAKPRHQSSGRIHSEVNFANVVCWDNNRNHLNGCRVRRRGEVID